MDKILYHGTISSNLFGIYSKGLIPKCNNNSFIMDNYIPAIHLTPNKKVARYYANRQMINSNKGKPVILTIKRPNIEFKCGRTKYCKTLIFIFYNRIPKNNIIKVEKSYLIKYNTLLKFFGIKNG